MPVTVHAGSFALACVGKPIANPARSSVAIVRTCATILLLVNIFAPNGVSNMMDGFDRAEVDARKFLGGASRQIS